MGKNRVLICLLLCAALLLGMAGCGSSKPAEPEATAPPVTEAPTEAPTETAPPATQPEASTEAPTLPESQPTESAPEPTETTPEPTESTEAEPEPTKPAETVPEALTVLPLPAETVQFSFLSGAGGWSTELVLNQDGSFTGQYHDSEMGDIGEDYPYGSIYVCSFAGEFVDFEKLSEYAYKMNLTNLTTENATGEEWIEEEIRYVASDPYGLEEGTEFILYLPDTPISEVPEEFLIWWPYLFEHDADPFDTLSCYGILNVKMGYGFFYMQ